MNRLNIIVPLYNPEPGWQNSFVSSLLELEKSLAGTDLKVILVNDGSGKDVGDIEALTGRFGFLKYEKYKLNRGKGYAVRYGIGSSIADYYIYTDLDFPFGTNVVCDTYIMLKRSEANIIIGRRDLSYNRMIPFKRHLLSFFVKSLAYIVTGFRIKDTQAGLKGLDNNARNILLATNINGFLFELEFLRKSLKNGLTIKPICVTCRPGIKFTNFKSNVISREFINLIKVLS